MYICPAILYVESEYLEEDEACDLHNIEQTDKGFRCAIDVPSVLYKWVFSFDKHPQLYYLFLKQYVALLLCDFFPP